MIRGIRGATTVPIDEKESILSATQELFETIIEQNELEPDQVASVFVTVTKDLHAAFPAQAIRTLTGWELVPVIGATEMTVTGAISRCIRLMVLAHTEKSQEEICPVYLRGAKQLRPDLNN